MQRRFLILVIVTLLAVLTWRQAVRAADPSTVVISQGVDAVSLDPLGQLATPSINVHNQIFDTLLRHDANGKLIPWLAVSWKQSAPTIWEFKLRPNVKFHNGDPLTSADVKFTIEKIKEPAYKSQWVQFVNTIERVDAPDPLTVRFITKRPTPVIPGRPWLVHIVDAKYWQQHGDAYMKDHPVGTGPYAFKAWRRDEAVEMDVNPNWWGPKPAVEHVVFKPIPDAAARVAALRTGETDVITNVPVQNALQIAGGRTTRMGSARSVRVLYFAFNPLKPGPQQNKMVRQALNYAVDVPAIIKNVIGGRAYEIATPIPPSFTGYDAKIPSYKHDLAKAKTLLAQAGYPDGKGIEIVVNAPIGRYNKDKEMAEALAGQLNAAGIKATVNAQEWTTYITQTAQHALSPIYELGWGNDTYDADQTLTPLFTSNAPYSTYNYPLIDKWLEDARFELDPAKRQALYSKVLGLIHEEALWIPFFQYEDLYGISKRLTWEPRGDELIYADQMLLK